MKKLTLIILIGFFALGFINFVPTASSSSSAQTAQRTVLAELFTGTWCRYCQGAEGAMDRLAKEYPRTRLTIIEWHNGDEYVTVDNSSSEREAFYDPHMSFPTAYFDGVNRVVGGSENPNDETVYNDYKREIEARLNVSSPLAITSTGYIEGGKAVICVEIKAVGDVVLSNLYAHFVLYNDHNETVYVDGREYRLRYTALRSSSEAISLSKGSSITLSKEFLLQSGWDRDKLGVVTFVQTHNKETHSESDIPPYYYTAEVLQSNDFRYINAELKIDKTVANVSPNGTANFNAILKNTRNRSDTYTIRLLKSLPSGWSANFCIGGICYLSESSLSLESQESKQIDINIASASTAVLGEVGTVEFVVTSALMPKGKSSVIFKAVTVSLPTPVVVNEDAKVSKNSVTLSWSRNTDVSFIRYEIHKALVANFIPSDETLVTTIYNQATTSYEVKGLYPNTDYYFKVRVVNDYGYSDSNEVHAKTLSVVRGDGAIPLTTWVIVIIMIATPVIIIPTVLVKVLKGGKK
ncbi:MAG: fibronectin type III domain-containing protein [Candidatus Thermoplasmatota archaeon]